MFEALENRELLTAVMDDGTLLVPQGTNYADHVWIQMDYGSPNLIFDDKVKVSHNVNGTWETDSHNLDAFTNTGLKTRINRVFLASQRR